MQIQPTIAAGAAAGSVSQSTSKDRAAGSSAADAATQATPATIEQVARSEQSSADRDAQGAGPMLGFKKGNKKKGEDAEQQPPSDRQSLPVKSPEPPGELDLIG